MIGYFFHASITMRQEGSTQPEPTGFSSARSSAYLRAVAYLTSWSWLIRFRSSGGMGGIQSMPKSGWYESAKFLGSFISVLTMGN